jgi:hypothetical protein
VKLPSENKIPDVPDVAVVKKAPATVVLLTNIENADGATELEATEGSASVGDAAFQVTVARTEPPDVE